MGTTSALYNLPNSVRTHDPSQDRTQDQIHHLDMPKVSKSAMLSATLSKSVRKMNTKKCKRCGRSAPSNVSKKCSGCHLLFPIKENRMNDRRGKCSKRCSVCSTMAKSNRAKNCFSCGCPYVSSALQQLQV
jgi:hypothetical protein